MKYQQVRFHVFVIACLLSLSFKSFADPLPTPTALPFPKGATDAEKFMVIEVSKLEVYPDSIDPNQYYYIPPFHVRQYAHGAANMLLNSFQISNFVNAQKALEKKDTYGQDKLPELERRANELESSILHSEETIFSAQQGLAEAIRLGNQDFINSSQSFLNLLHDRYQKLLKEFEETKKIIQSGGTILPEGVRKELDMQAISYLAMGGVRVFIDEDDFAQKIHVAIREGMARLANTSGGYLITNIYAGFSETQLEALRAYKAKYYPNIKISLMPTRNMEFFPLFEAVKEDKYAKYSDEVQQSFLRNIAGSGDYLGATVVIYTSVSGGMALASHLGPFILPMGIRADLEFDTGTTDVELDCDFAAEFSIAKRDTIKPGVSIYDSPENLLLLNKHDNSMCKIVIHEGSAASVEYWVKKTIEQAMVHAGAVRTMLTMTERIEYGNVLEQGTNKPYIPPRFYRLDNPSEYFGWFPVAHRPGMYGMVPEYHYAVDKEQVNSFSKLRVKKHIYIKGQEKIKKDLATNLCLVYNPERQVYDRCIEVERQNSQSMVSSALEALSSPSCKSTDNPFDCGKMRDTSLSRAPRNFIADESVVPAI